MTGTPIKARKKSLIGSYETSAPSYLIRSLTGHLVLPLQEKILRCLYLGKVNTPLTSHIRMDDSGSRSGYPCNTGWTYKKTMHVPQTLSTPRQEACRLVSVRWPVYGPSRFRKNCQAQLDHTILRNLPPGSAWGSAWGSLWAWMRFSTQ